ncbi:hypothetical protein B0H19DRAFT_1055861 [Mycena capillaripes]|nr:hypothetical protein B0H19DRAFT_1055861 [Mycena capillaripes]
MATNDIYVRQYRPSDFPQIRALLFEGIPTSGSFIEYTNLRDWRSILRHLAVVMVWVVAVALFAARRRTLAESIYAHHQDALKTDMRDILTHYRAPGAFFVAVRSHKVADVEPGGAAPDEEEVVGYVGLQYLPEKDAHTAEVRRLVVPERHQGSHGVGDRLMRTLIVHAEAIPGLQWLELRSVEFSPAPHAQPPYSWLGWELVQVKRLNSSPHSPIFCHIRRPIRPISEDQEVVVSLGRTFGAIPIAKDAELNELFPLRPVSHPLPLVTCI